MKPNHNPGSAKAIAGPAANSALKGPRLNIQTRAGVILALIILTIIPFLPALKGPFFYDDYNTIVMNPAIKSPQYLSYFYKLETFSADRSRMFRPLIVSSLALNRHLFKDQTLGWHLTNLLAHLLCTVFAFLLIESLSASTALAFLAALFFGIHPSRVEPVAYISARSELFASFFYLLSFYLFVGSRESEQKSARIPLAGFSLAGFWLGLLSKDIAITLPAVLTLERFASRKLDRAAAGWLSAFWISALGYFLIRSVLSVDTFFPPARPRPVAENILIQSRVLVYYLSWLFFPIHNSVEIDFSPLSRGPALLSILFLTVIFGAGVAWLRFRPLRGFLVLFFFIVLSPSSSVVPLVVEGNITRVYLAGLPVFWGLAGLILSAAGSGKKRFALALSAILLVCFFSLSTSWAGKWQSPIRLWRETVKTFTGHSRAHSNLGLLLERSGNYPQAELEYLAAIRSESGSASALDNYARVLFARSDLEQAELYFKKSLELEPTNCITRINYSQLLIVQDRLQEAWRVLEGARFCPVYRQDLEAQKDKVKKLLGAR